MQIDAVHMHCSYVVELFTYVFKVFAKKMAGVPDNDYLQDSVPFIKQEERTDDPDTTEVSYCLFFIKLFFYNCFIQFIDENMIPETTSCY